MAFKSALRSLQAERRRRASLAGVRSYASKVLGFGPAAYYRAEETSGTDAADSSGNGYDGTYVNGPSLGQPGKVKLCPAFDGADQCVNVLASAAGFVGPAGTLCAWTRVANAGVWTDGVYRWVGVYTRDANNFARIGKTSTNNQLIWQYMANAVSKSVLSVAHATTAWQLLTLTWDLSADEMKAWAGASQVGATQTNLGVWAGGAPLIAVIGASTAAGVQPWHGWLDEMVLFPRALTGAEIAALAAT